MLFKHVIVRKSSKRNSVGQLSADRWPTGHQQVTNWHYTQEWNTLSPINFYQQKAMTFSVGIFSFSFLNMYLTAQQDCTQNITQKVKILARLVVRWAKFTFLAAVKIMAANKIHVGLVECFVFWYSKIFFYIKEITWTKVEDCNVDLFLQCTCSKASLLKVLVCGPVTKKGKMSFFNDSIFFQLDFKLVVYQLP